MVGGGYVLSHLLVDFVARNGMLLKAYANEDVSVGTWLAGLNVHYVHDPRFDTEYMVGYWVWSGGKGGRILI